MAIKDRNGALHSEKNGQFVSNGEGESSGFDVEKLSKEPKGRSGTILPGRGEEPELQTSGATSGAIDPDSERGQEHAERFYEEMRHRKDDISSIATKRNTIIT
jgi:hypothetical protein